MININGEYIRKETDTKIKEQLLKTEGATITKNSDASITITGPFSISTYERIEELQKGSTALYNSGIIIVESSFPFLYKFNNLSNGKLHIKSGVLEDIFTKPEQLAKHKFHPT